MTFFLQRQEQVNVQQLQSRVAFKRQMKEWCDDFKEYVDKSVLFNRKNHHISKEELLELEGRNMLLTQRLNLLKVYSKILFKGDKDALKLGSIIAYDLFFYMSKLDKKDQAKFNGFKIYLIKMLKKEKLKDIPPPKVSNKDFNKNMLMKSVSRIMSSKNDANNEDLYIEKNKVKLNQEITTEIKSREAKKSWNYINSVSTKGITIDNHDLVKDIKETQLDWEFDKKFKKRQQKPPILDDDSSSSSSSSESSSEDTEPGQNTNMKQKYENRNRKIKNSSNRNIKTNNNINHHRRKKRFQDEYQNGGRNDWQHQYQNNRHQNHCQHQYQNHCQHQYQNHCQHQYQNGCQDQYQNEGQNQYQNEGEYTYQNKGENQYQNGYQNEFDDDQLSDMDVDQN